MAMSWKEGVLIYLILCSILLVFVVRHFFGDLIFLAEHVIAMGLVHGPALLHFVVGGLR